jgi:catechol 2,3-dioxygenase-like lactoylglutathione lyase family enzyme
MKYTLTFFLGLVSFVLCSQTIERVDAIGLTVNNMDRALEFYTNVLPFEKVTDIEVAGQEFEQLKGLFGIRYRKVRLRLGSEEIELTDFLTAGGRPIPFDSKSNDLWFQHIAIVVSDMDSAYARLRRHNVVHVSTSPQTLPKSIPAAEGIKAFYFQDPDGHNLELIYFPQGKGNPRWKKIEKRLFLGIDHTAIGISNTEKSKTFYNEILGLKFHGDSYNFGTEQEHLNNVFGARLHISGNTATSGPGIEFLDYLSPKTGRPYPADERADDLVHWETILTTAELERMYQKLVQAAPSFISSAIVRLSVKDYGYKRGFYVRDPDGHVIGIFEK